MESEHILQIPLPKETQLHVFFREIQTRLTQKFSKCSIHFLPYFNPRNKNIYLPPVCQEGPDLYLFYSHGNGKLSELHLASYLKPYQAHVHKANDHIAENIYARQVISSEEQKEWQVPPQQLPPQMKYERLELQLSQ